MQAKTGDVAEATTKRMKANRPFDTRPEVELRSSLYRSGLRFRKHASPWPDAGFTPDILFPRAQVAVYVDGCFWHGCPEHRPISIHRSAFWRSKVERTIERDRQQEAALMRRGWQVVRVWEHDESRSASERIQLIVRSRTAR